MYRDIRKRMVILGNRAPFKSEVKSHLTQLEAREWIAMNMTLQGCMLTGEKLECVLDGGCILEASIEEHMMINRLTELRDYIYRLSDMKAELSVQILKDMHSIIVDGDRNEGYRKGHPILLEYGYNPILPQDIAGELARLVDFANRKEDGENVFQRATKVHNCLLAIYPFKEGNQILARAAMYYLLALEGFPMAALELTESAYNQQVMAYLKGAGSEALATELMKAVFYRFELMMQLTDHDN